MSCILEILPQKDFSIQAVPDDDKSITFLVNIYNITTASIAQQPEGFPVVLAVQQFAVTRQPLYLIRAFSIVLHDCFLYLAIGHWENGVPRQSYNRARQ